MAKIIGKESAFVKRCTCRSCASIIEYTENEVKESTHYDYGGGRDTYRVLPCPGCGRDIYLN